MSHPRKPEHAVTLKVIQPRSVLNASGMGGFTLNPYVGCPVGCAYCYVPHMAHKQLEDRKWGTYVDVKEGAPELLEQQLARKRQPARIFMSTATDPYQPVEERYQITRRMLEVFERHPQAQPVHTHKTIARRARHRHTHKTPARRCRHEHLYHERRPRAGDRTVGACYKRTPRDHQETVRGRHSDLPVWAPAFVPLPMTDKFVRGAICAIAESGARALSLDALNYRSRQPAGLTRRLAREGHAPATKAQANLIRNEADRRGLGRRLELAEPESIEDTEPMLPFE